MEQLLLEVDGRPVGLTSSERSVIGRDPSIVLTVSHPLVSRRHLEVSFESGRWIARDLGTRNGTFVGGRQQIPSHPIELRPGEVVMLGNPQSGLPLRVVAIRKAAPLPGNGVPSGRPVTIGRAQDNSIVVDDPMASAYHARVIPIGESRYLVEDLDSTNGTFVNGARVRRQEVRVGGLIQVGGASLLVRAEGLVPAGEMLVPPASDSRPGLTVSQVSFTVPVTKAERGAGAGSHKVLLDRVSFSVPRRSLLAVIGPSGAGKSTLLKTMTGALKPDEGQVLFDGVDMSFFSDAVADRVGVVPQDDLIHTELTARQALDYAARLRFPDHSSAADRREAVDWVLRELGLVQHADTRIARMSGGQRKRVSTAMELLTKPDLLFLDEPTSGLDPNLDREVMELLRDLAHGTAQNPGGRTVVVITHSTANLDKADLVLLLAPGGKVAYFGPPEGVRPFFAARIPNETSYADIYSLITQSPDDAQAVFANSGLASPPVPIVPVQAPPPAEGVGKRRRLVPQMLTLLSRQARLMVSDRSLIAFTLALPVVVGLLTLAVRAAEGFNPASSTQATGDPMVLMVVLVFGAVLMGMVPAVRQLVGERPIFVREAGIGVSPAAYLTSKVLLLGAVSAIQSGLMVTVALILNGHPHTGVVWPLGLELFVMAFATAWVCSVLGLLLSGVVSTSEQVMPLMVLVLMFQLVMSGGVLDVTGPGINQASLISPSRWGYAAGASSLDFNRTIKCHSEVLVKAKEDEEVNKKAKETAEEANQRAAEDAVRNGLPIPDPEEPEVRKSVVDCAAVEGQDQLWDATSARLLGNLLALGFWFTVYSAGTYASVRRLVR